MLLHRYISAVVVLCTLEVAGQDSSATAALDKAEVRIPYLELRKLWESAEAARKPKPTEPLPRGALLAAQFTADLAEGKLAFAAEFKLESFGGQYELIRLMGAGLAVASVEPPETRLLVDGDDLCIMAKDAGPLMVRLRFVDNALATGAEVPFLRLVTVPSAVATLTVNGLPPDRLVRTKDGIIAARGGSCTIPLPSKGTELALSLTDAALLPKPEPPPAPPQPSEWSLQNEVLVYQGESELTYRARVHAIAQNGSALEAALVLPANARAVKVEGEDLADTRQARNPDGQTVLRLRWHTRDLMERELRVGYALQQLPLAESWDLHAPSLVGEGEVKSLFMVAVPSGTECKGPGVQSAVPLAKLPRWLVEETKALEFSTAASAAAISVQCRPLPRLETAVATITKGEFATKLVSDGSVLTEASLEIEHDEAVRWLFTLPEKCELLKCTVNDRPLKPITREAGAMEIPLDSPAGAK
ncbi:MAG: hypothetical protein ACOYMN_11710, partial [Roseimicrobium sp.]